MIKVGFKKLTEDAILPVKAHSTDSGFDLFASEDVIILPGETIVIKTGIAVDLPVGYEAQVRPRSGVTSKTKLRMQLGTIDNDYTGEIGIIIDNIWRKESKSTPVLQIISGKSIFTGKYYGFKVMETKGTYLIRKGDKLAQLVIQSIPVAEAYEIEELPTTERGSNGFGSSGF